MSSHDSYESQLDQELSMKSLVMTAIGLVLLIVISGGLMWGLSVVLREQSASADPPPPVLEEARESYTPPLPRLQTDPVYEMEVLRAKEAEILESYGWVDENAGIGQVPIERALELYALGRLQAATEAPVIEETATGTDG